MIDQYPLVIQDLNIGFDKSLFANLHLKIKEKEFVTLMGENGVGKTTLIDTLMGYKKQAAGSIYFWGQDFSGNARSQINQKVGWVVSHQEVYPVGLSIEGLFNSIKPLYPTWDSTLESELVNRFKLNLQKKMCHLSLGERSKVKLIKALAFRPQLLILDELTANLSQESKEVILGALLDLFATSKMSVLYISHSKDEALRLSDRVIYLTTSGLKLDKGSQNE